jgi:hypothetical protein
LFYSTEDQNQSQKQEEECGVKVDSCQEGTIESYSDMCEIEHKKKDGECQRNNTCINGFFLHFLPPFGFYFVV